MLYLQGDIDRGYVYISHCLKAALLYPNRVRVINISAVMDKLQHAYSQRNEMQEGKLRKSLRIVSILSVVLFVSVLFICLQFGKLSRSRKNWMKRTGFLTCTLENFPMLTGCWRM